MSTWPPSDTPAFAIIGAGIQLVLIQDSRPGGCHEVCMAVGTLHHDGQTNTRRREWSMATAIVAAGDLFATKHAAEAAIAHRQDRQAA